MPVWKMVHDKVACVCVCVTKLWERWCVKKLCVTKMCVRDGVWQIVWQSCCVKYCVANIACDKVVGRMVCDKVVCERWRWRQTGTKRHQSQPSAMSATPATQSEGQCHQVPRLPRKVKVGVTKCHDFHAKSRRDHGAKREPSAPPEPGQCHKCHACHAKWRSMSPSATISTQRAAATTAPFSCMIWL